MENVKTTEKYSVRIDFEKGYVHVEVKNFMNDEQVKEMNLEQLKALERSGLKLLFNDFRNLKVVSPEAQEWVVKNFFPRAEKLGLKRLAFLHPKDIFGEIAMEVVNAQVVGNILLADFHDKGKALEWLTENEKKPN